MRKSKTKYIYTILDNKNKVAYSSKSLSLLAENIGYKKRASEYWHKKLKINPFLEIKQFIILKTEIIRDSRGGLKSTSGLWGKEKSNEF